MVTNIFNWIIDSGPHMAIGRWLGPAPLGQYTIANNLVKVPADHLVRNLQAVLFPLAARAHDNEVGLRRAYLTVLAGIGLVSFPTFTLVALTSHQIVLLLLGAKWVLSGDVLAPLSLAMILHTLEALCGPILGGRGEPRVELRVKMTTLAVMLCVLALTISISVVAVAWGVTFTYLIRWIWMNAAVMRQLHISIANVGHALLGPTILAGVSSTAVFGVHTSFGANITLVLPHWLLLLTTGCSVLGIAVVVLSIPQIVLDPNLLRLFDRLVKKYPALAQTPGLQRIVDVASRSGC